MMNPSQVDLVGVGLNAIDTLIPVPHFPARGSKVEIRSATILPGGQVATAIMACQQWGLRTRYVGKIGDDAAAALHRAEFARVGVEAHLLPAPACSSQQAFILVDESGERTVLWKRDERLTLRPEELQRDWILNSRALHVDGHDTAAAAQAAAWARAAGIPVIADLDELYPGVDALLQKHPRQANLPRHLAEIPAGDSLPLRLPSHRRHFGSGWRPRLGREAVPLRVGFSDRGRGYHRRGRYFPRRIHLRASARLAVAEAARFCLRRCRAELHRCWRSRRHRARYRHRAPHVPRRSPPLRLCAPQAPLVRISHNSRSTALLHSFALGGRSGIPGARGIAAHRALSPTRGCPARPVPRRHAAPAPWMSAPVVAGRNSSRPGRDPRAFAFCNGGS